MSEDKGFKPAASSVVFGQLTFVLLGLAVVLLAVVLVGAIADRYFTKKQMQRGVELEKQEAFARGLSYEAWKALAEAAAREEAEFAQREPAIQAAPAGSEGEATGRVALSAPDVTCTPEEVEALKNKTVIIHTTMGSFTFWLRPDFAPVAVKNFVYLAGQGFYDGMAFYRTYPGIFLQTGSPTGLARASAGYEIPMPASGLFPAIGAVACLPSEDETMTSSEFCIFLADSSSFEGVLSVFGAIAAKWDVIEKVADSDYDRDGYLYDRAYITRIDIVDRDTVPPELVDPLVN